VGEPISGEVQILCINAGVMRRGGACIERERDPYALDLVGLALAGRAVFLAEDI